MQPYVHHKQKPQGRCVMKEIVEVSNLYFASNLTTDVATNLPIIPRLTGQTLSSPRFKNCGNKMCSLFKNCLIRLQKVYFQSNQQQLRSAVRSPESSIFALCKIFHEISFCK